jgi:threonyl-tRNA synthetase
MNCPGHTLIYQNLVRSYRDLPLRLAEFGNVIRHEPSGTLHGILRARSFTQDDAHIFCTEEQLTQEVIECTGLVKQLYGAFGFDPESVKVKFSTRPEKRIGTDEDWDRAEASLEKACEAAKLHTVISPGEGAFYGPKLEFTLVDCLGREWQCGTIQVDYILSSKDRLNVDYVSEEGDKKHPIIIHRALLGSFERFIGILIEHYEGKFPFWLAPEQVRVLQVTDDQNEYAQKVTDQLFRAGFAATLDTHQEKLGAKIRRARLDRVPYFLVIGGKEVEDGTVSLQKQDGSKLGNMSVDELMQRFSDEAQKPLT